VNPLVWAAVLVAGGIGAVLRFLLDESVSRRASGAFPLGTLLVNLSGAFLLGLVLGLGVPREVTLVLGTGVLGSYTTFSTWMFETQRLVEEWQSRRALVNLGVSVVAGVASAALGLWIGGRL